MRSERPDPEDFIIPLRTGWAPLGMDPARIRNELTAYTEAGIQYVVAAPWRSNPGDWRKAMEMLAELVIVT